MLIRLSEEEYNQVKQNIEASGMNQQDWLWRKSYPRYFIRHKKTEV